MTETHLPLQDVAAPKLVALDASESPVDVSSWWSEAPVVAIFLRHFG